MPPDLSLFVNIEVESVLKQHNLCQTNYSESLYSSNLKATLFYLSIGQRFESAISYFLVHCYIGQASTLPEMESLGPIDELVQ